MACFIIPAAEAAVVTAVRLIAEQKNKTYSVTKVNPEQELAKKETVLYKTRWLTNLLWGGSALLAFEHVWHGEVTPWFPFLTAMKDPDSMAEMLHEMGTNGVGMALLVTAVWAGMVLISHIRNRKYQHEVHVS